MKLKLESTTGKEFNLDDFKGQKVLLYFYPKDNTPGCIREGEAFAENYKKIKKLGVEIFGISRDTLSSHAKFRTKMNFPFHLLSDPDEVACKLFDVIKMKNMYGKKVRGIERSSFLLDENGKVIHEWRKVKADSHVPDVLEFLKSL